MGKNFFGLLLLVFIVFASGIGRNMVEVEGATCAKPSKFYHGFCLNGCAQACQRENWPGGQCVVGTWFPRCECRRPC